MPKKGYKQTKEHKKNTLKAQKGRVGKSNPNWKGGEVEIICKQCGKHKKVKPSEIMNSNGKYCSRGCYYLAQKTKIKKICLRCGKEFKARPKRGKYCSQKCYFMSNIGKNNPNWKGGGIEYICLYCKKSFKVMHYRIKKVKYCSSKCFGLANSIGKNNPNWNNGKSFEPYTPEFNKQLKELIRIRDNYYCQKCDLLEIENGQRLSIHHIDYDKENCLPNNLISLCRSCSGIVNSNRSKWEKYFLNNIRNETFNKNQLNIKIAI